MTRVTFPPRSVCALDEVQDFDGGHGVFYVQAVASGWRTARWAEDHIGDHEQQNEHRTPGQKAVELLASYRSGTASRLLRWSRTIRRRQAVPGAHDGEKRTAATVDPATAGRRSHANTRVRGP